MEDDFKITCQICGFRSTNLCGHIPKKHKMTIAEYKLKFNVERVLVYTPEQLQSKKEKQKLKPYDKKKSAYCIEHWLEKGFTEEEAKYQVACRQIAKPEYWTSRGYTEEEGREEYSKIVKNRSNLKCLIEIHGETEGIKLHDKIRERGRKNSHRRVDYWIAKGFTEEEAKIEVSKVQTTRSLAKNIELYGEEEGTRKTQEINRKWQATLNAKSDEEKREFNLRKDSSSLEHLKLNYPEDYIERYIQKMLFPYRNGKDAIYEPIRYIVDNITTLDDLIKYVSESFSNIRNVKRTISNKIIVDIFKIKNVEEVLNRVYEVMDFKNRECGLYGNRTFFDGHIFLSDIELQIAKFLVDNSIEYEYGKLYPFAYSRHRHCYDFYIKEIDLYVEYAGMKNTEFYDKRLEHKIKKCHEFGLNVLASNNILEIKNSILQKIDEINE